MTPQREFHLFSRYLVGAPGSAALAERYAAACEILGPDLGRPSRLLKAARQRPGLLPFLDGAAGVLRPKDTLRKRLFLASSILEASPEFTRHFLPVQSGPIGLFFKLGWVGFRAVACAAVGAVLLMMMPDSPKSGRGR